MDSNVATVGDVHEVEGVGKLDKVAGGGMRYGWTGDGGREKG
jgi:hypothetical protein